jgi:hypothetical protein
MRLAKISFTILFAILGTNAAAGINAYKGFYIGGNLQAVAYSRVQGAALGGVFPFGSSSLVARPYIGYRFNDFFALEAGYNDFVNEDNYTNNDVWGPDHYRLYSVDLAGKFIAPFESGFSVFAKGGLAYTHQNVYNQTFVGGIISANTNSNQIQPLVGLGTSYNFNKNFAAELGVNYYFPVGNIGEISVLGLGINYTFGNE